MLSTLCFCTPRASCVVESSVDDVWNVIRDWDKQRWISEMDGANVSVHMVEGSGAAVGSVRVVQLGQARMYERLVGLDEEIRCLKWRLISHPDSISPFPSASYINFFTTISLREVTQGNQTFVNWEGEFYTEHEHAKEMDDLFLKWFESGLKQLQVFMSNPRRQRPDPGPTNRSSHAPQISQQQFLHSTAAHHAPPNWSRVGQAGEPPTERMSTLASTSHYMQGTQPSGYSRSSEGMDPRMYRPPQDWGDSRDAMSDKHPTDWDEYVRQWSRR